MLVRHFLCFSLLMPLSMHAASPTGTQVPKVASAAAAKPVQAFLKGSGIQTTYGLFVPPQGELHLRLVHPKVAWIKFLLQTPGDATPHLTRMSQGFLRLKGGNEAWYKNPDDKPKLLHVYITDTAQWSSLEDPFTLEIERNWGPEAMKETFEPWIVKTF